MAFLGTGPTEAESNARDAAGRASDDMQASGQAYSNYRQYARDAGASRLSNQASLYQGMLNRMASAYGAQGMPNVSQMGNNPISLAQTTVGATHGSNAAGGVALDSGGVHVNEGIIDQLGLSNDPRRAQDLATGNQQKYHPELNNPDMGPAGRVDVTQNYRGLDPNYNNLNINTQAGNAPAPYQPQGGGGQFSFAPRRA